MCRRRVDLETKPWNAGRSPKVSSMPPRRVDRLASRLLQLLPMLAGGALPCHVDAQRIYQCEGGLTVLDAVTTSEGDPLSLLQISRGAAIRTVPSWTPAKSVEDPGHSTAAGIRGSRGRALEGPRAESLEQGIVALQEDMARGLVEDNARLREDEGRDLAEAEQLRGESAELRRQNAALLSELRHGRQLLDKEARRAELLNGTLKRATRNKNFMVLLEVLGLGAFGFDRIYLGIDEPGHMNIFFGILKFVSFGGLGVWAVVDYAAIILNALSKQKEIHELGMSCMWERGTIEASYVMAMVGCILFLSCTCLACCNCCCLYIFAGRVASAASRKAAAADGTYGMPPPAGSWPDDAPYYQAGRGRER